ncbi:MAG: oxidoreductase [Firmicutes bacterium HGW-Firmicutes-1]|nr:MAG: oxidoreductase [Firmicutes bacterium HGW-Firmicutes-1]
MGRFIVCNVLKNKKICVIGAGRWGQNHIRTLHEMGNLAGIVENDPNRLSESLLQYNVVKGYQNVKDSLRDNYDGYVIATPAQTHYEIGSQLLKQKKNVLIEKPIALSTIDANRLIWLSQVFECKLMVGHLLLFHPAIKKIKELIDQGKIGKLLYLYSTRLNMGTVRTEENVFYSFAPHDISVINYLIGTTPISMSAEGGCFLQQNIHDVVMASLTYPNNVKAHIFVSWLYPFLERRLIVVGDKGTLVFEDSNAEQNIVFYNKSIDWENASPIVRVADTEHIDYEKSAPLKNELEYFVKNLDADITVADGQSGYEVVKILEEVSKQLNLKC